VSNKTIYNKAQKKEQYTVGKALFLSVPQVAYTWGMVEVYEKTEEEVATHILFIHGVT
jgi:hypothetical protein